MSSFNHVTLVGNVGKDGELKYLPNGTPVLSFSIATSEVWNDKDGKKQERTDWHRVELFGKVAGAIAQYVVKGKQLLVEGSIRYEKWTDKEGKERTSTKIRSHRVVLLGSSGQKTRDPRPNEDVYQAKDEAHFAAADDDEVPF